MRRPGMGRVPDQNHSSTMPIGKLNPFDWPEVELLVTLQSRQIRGHGRGKINKATSEAFEPTGEGVLKAFSANRSKAIGVTLAHRNQAEKASLAHEDNQSSGRWA
jgi:hypothetical protein